MLMSYHIGRLVLSSLCVRAFVAVGICWCSFYGDIKLVFHSSTIAMMHGPTNIKLESYSNSVYHSRIIYIVSSVVYLTLGLHFCSAVCSGCTKWCNVLSKACINKTGNISLT